MYHHNKPKSLLAFENVSITNSQIKTKPNYLKGSYYAFSLSLNFSQCAVSMFGHKKISTNLQISKSTPKGDI